MRGNFSAMTAVLMMASAMGSTPLPDSDPRPLRPPRRGSELLRPGQIPVEWRVPCRRPDCAAPIGQGCKKSTLGRKFVHGVRAEDAKALTAALEGYRKLAEEGMKKRGSDA